MTTAPLFEQVGARASGNWVTLPVGSDVEGRPVLAGRNPEGRLVLLVPATARAAGERLVTRGLVARVGALLREDVHEDWLQITCREEHLDGTFALLADDVLVALDAADPGQDPVDVALATVQRWQKLLEALGKQRMSDAQAAGLLAELKVLEALVARIGVDRALRAWTGHDRARLDFRFAAAGVEVKATTQRERFKVEIHGLLQLDPVEVGALHLWAEQMEQVPEGGDSVPAARDRLIDAGCDAWDLDEAMAGAGYRPVDEAELRGVQFRTLDTRAVSVGPGTPRLVRDAFVDHDVPDFVSAVSYQLDLTDFTDAQGLLAGLNTILESVT